jgi:hypothetical protein
VRARGRVGLALWIACVAVVAAFAASVSPDPASAQSSPLPPIDKLAARTASDPMVKQFWKDVMRNAVVSDSAKRSAYVDPLTTATRGRIFNTLMRSRIAARLLPASGSSAMLRVGLVGVGAYVGWRVYQHFTGGNETLDVWLDSSSLGADALYAGNAVPFAGNKSCDPSGGDGGTACLRWFPHTTPATPPSVITGSEPDCALVCGQATDKAVGAAWVYATVNDGTNASCAPQSEPCYVLYLSPKGYDTNADTRSSGNCTSAGSTVNSASCWWSWGEVNLAGQAGTGAFWGSNSQTGWDNQWPRQLAYMQWQTFENIALRFPGHKYVSQTNGTYPSVHRYRLILTPDELLGGASVQPTGSGTPPHQDNYTVPAPYTADPEVGGTDTDLTNALGPFQDDPCSRAWLNWVLDPAEFTFDNNCLAHPPVDPGTETTGTFVVPQPAVDETYTSYLSRLRAAGFLGSVSRRVWSEEEAVSALEPDALTRVKLGSPGSAADYYDTLSWPGTSPTIAIDHAITVWSNPGPESGTGGSTSEDDATQPPLAPGDPTGATCDCPPVDFSPITEADVGSKFPFGVITWVSGWLGALSGSPTAPEFDFTNPAWGGTHYDVNLDVMDDYAATIRTLISWCMWIGAIWWFGTRLLGFTATGDPGEAVDDAW